jgi:SAM-dependent methyltransferase
VPITSQQSGLDERSRLLPAELLPIFDDTFVESCDRYETYIAGLTRQVFETTGLRSALGAPATLAEALQRAGLDPHVASVPVRWILERLGLVGNVRVEGGGDSRRYTLVDGRPGPDPDHLYAEQERRDPQAIPSYDIARLAAGQYPAVLRGEQSGEQALFAADHMTAWSRYFDNANELYAPGNMLGAMACDAALTARGGAVLELGGGLGSAASALCARLAERGHARAITAYRFSELSLPFLRRAQKSLRAAYPDMTFAFARLDMNRPFQEGGVAPREYALVHAVNALHVAHDLGFTLAEIRTALSPDGVLVATECIRPFAGQPIYIEFVFNLLESFQHPRLVPDWRPNGGFLTPEQWALALGANGFRDVEFFPDVRSIRDAYPSFIVAAITARRA